MVSALSGFVFAVGWWFAIDAAVTDEVYKGAFWLPGIASTLGLLMINSISNEAVKGETYDARCGPGCARLWILIGLIL